MTWKQNDSLWNLNLNPKTLTGPNSISRTLSNSRCSTAQTQAHHFGNGGSKSLLRWEDDVGSPFCWGFGASHCPCYCQISRIPSHSGIASKNLPFPVSLLDTIPHSPQICLYLHNLVHLSQLQLKISMLYWDCTCFYVVQFSF